MQNTEKNSKKYVLLGFYVLCVLCLLAGLFVPLFDGKILALQLPDALKCIAGKGNPEASYPFTMGNMVNLFGVDRLSFNAAALFAVLYAAVTAVSLLAFIPVAFSVRGKGKAAKRIYYGIEISAVISLVLLFTVLLQSVNKPYSAVIALGGAAVALTVHSGMNKGKRSAVKIIMFLLSAIAFLALFDFVVLLSKQTEYASLQEKIKLAAGLYGSEGGAVSGVSSLSALFTSKLGDELASYPDAKGKTLMLLCGITATLVLVNLFADAIKLATKKDKKAVLIFDIARYGLELAAAAALLITLFTTENTIGLMLAVILAMAFIETLTAVLRFVILCKKRKKFVNDADEEKITDEDVADDEYDGLVSNTDESEYNDDGGEFAENDYPETHDEPEEIPVTDEEVSEPESEPDDGYYAEQPVYDDGYYAEEPEPVTEPEPEPVPEPIPEEQSDAEPVNPFYEADNSTYIHSTESEPEVEQFAEEQPETAEVEAIQPEQEEQPEIMQPETAEVERVEDIEEEPVKSVPLPYEDIEPYNPYERHNNPFGDFEQPQPYNPYAPVNTERNMYEPPVQSTRRAFEQKNEKPFTPPYEEEYENYEKPVNPYERRPQNSRPAYEKPVYEKPYEQPAYEKPVYEKPYEQPAYEQPVYDKPNFDRPVQTYKPFEQNPAQGARPLQPRPIIQEFKPVPNYGEREPAKEPNVYTIDTIYAGPTDEFIRKLTNDERIEFARTFIEKNRGNLGNIPEYVIGGDNRKFFSVVFIYLGRIRGLVSDELLNKMYKELNML